MKALWGGSEEILPMNVVSVAKYFTGRFVCVVCFKTELEKKNKKKKKKKTGETNLK